MIKKLNENKIVGNFLFIKTYKQYNDPDECPHSITVKKLIDELKKFDQNADVIIKNSNGEYCNLRFDGFITSDEENLINGEFDDVTDTDYYHYDDYDYDVYSDEYENF